MGSLAFLIVFAFPGVGSSWLNYMLPASRSHHKTLLNITYVHNSQLFKHLFQVTFNQSAYKLYRGKNMTFSAWFASH